MYFSLRDLVVTVLILLACNFPELSVWIRPSSINTNNENNITNTTTTCVGRIARKAVTPQSGFSRQFSSY